MNLSPPTDAALWSRARNGDERAFGMLFDRHARTIYNYCFRRTADWSAAEDLTSVVFLETWRRRAEVSMRSDSLLPWLYGVATNVVHTHRRSLRRHRDALARMPALNGMFDGTEDAAERIDAERRMTRILESIKTLSRRDQEILALCVWEELEYAEAAQVLGIPVGTVRSRLARARERLRARTGAGPSPGPARQTRGTDGQATSPPVPRTGERPRSQHRAHEQQEHRTPLFVEETP